MNRYVVLVDAGYLLASMARVLTGSSNRNMIQVSWEKLVAQMKLEIAERQESQSPGSQLLRVQWYDSPPEDSEGKRSAEEAFYAIDAISRTKTRIGRTSFGNQKGVDVKLALDIVNLAMRGLVTDMYLVSGDDDLTEAVEIAQDYGVRVHLYNVAAIEGSPAKARFGLYSTATNLARRADERHTISPEVIQRAASIAPRILREEDGEDRIGAVARMAAAAAGSGSAEAVAAAVSEAAAGAGAGADADLAALEPAGSPEAVATGGLAVEAGGTQAPPRPTDTPSAVTAGRAPAVPAVPSAAGRPGEAAAAGGSAPAGSAAPGRAVRAESSASGGEGAAPAPSSSTPVARPGAQQQEAAPRVPMPITPKLVPIKKQEIVYRSPSPGARLEDIEKQEAATMYEAIEQVVRQTVASLVAVGRVESVLRKWTRPSIPSDIDRALLIDVCLALGDPDMDIPSWHRQEMRNVFWDEIEALELD
ncbi:NYN domain-containing protein [Falsarthrobacter nasiphocae]|uniref:Uncharacterized LabA/DUF88 family protein n=1 Tax=Falsarthrobacter nasiphocae TaxID=189863 RepID=A0AAE3YHF2_9MICC|nr:NYN domain-containing protein [Falsarthrobacter nasiphocae]MDR6892264.1 uncharacterized LabA/DUF88 family protein [Falsarthrobacter nasiphocae]